MAKRFEAGLKKDFSEIAFKEVNDFLMQPKQELRTFAKQIVQVAFTDEKNKELIGLIFDAQIDYGLIIARTFSSCLRAPSVIR